MSSYLTQLRQQQQKSWRSEVSSSGVRNERMCWKKERNLYVSTSTTLVWLGWVFLLGQQLSEEFGKLSSVRRVPVMKDGNFILTERYDGRRASVTAPVREGCDCPLLVLLQHCNPEVPGAETLVGCGRSLVSGRPAAAGARERVPVLAAHEPQEPRLEGLPAQGASHFTNTSTSERVDLSLLFQFSRLKRSFTVTETCHYWSGSVSAHDGLGGAKGEDGRRLGGSEAVTQPAGEAFPAGQTVHRGQPNLPGWPGGCCWNHAGKSDKNLKTAEGK